MTDSASSAHPFVVLARAPLRVSLAGGGTDLPSFADQYGGIVISLAITRYVSLTVFPRSFDGAVRFTGEETEQAPDAYSMRHRFARAALLRAGVCANIQVASCTDAPSGTGLGGSGAFTVALLHALWKEEKPDPTQLAEEASEIEMVDLDRPVGKHDHYMAAYGGMRALHIDRSRSVQVEDLVVSETVRRYLRDRLLLFYTGLSRDAGQVLTGQDWMTRYGDTQTVASLHEIHDVATRMLDAIRAGRVDDIGQLMHEHWLNKVRLSAGVSNPRIDELYRVARSAGSDGGKLLGAGGGGFLLVSVREGQVDRLRAAMAAERVRELPFDLDCTGSQVTGLPV